MLEEKTNVDVEKKETLQLPEIDSTENKESGSKEPRDEDIVKNIDNYEYRVNQIVIFPTIEVYKDGKLVKLISNTHQRKLSGTINKEYADKLLKDIADDFKIGYPIAYENSLNK